MAGLINWKKVSTPNSNPDADHVYVGVGLDGILYLKNSNGSVSKYITENFIENFETTSQLNARDSANRDRSNHTGTQNANTITGLANVAISGSYSDLQDTPIIPDVSNFETTSQLNARDSANRDRSNHTGTQNANTIEGGGAFNFAGFDSEGKLTGLEGFQYNSYPANGLQFFKNVIPEDTNNFRRFHSIMANYDPIVADSQETWQHMVMEMNIGENNSGNQLGDKTNGQGGVEGLSVFVNSRQSSDFGRIVGVTTGTQLGEEVEGREYSGFRASVNMQSESKLGFLNPYNFNISSASDAEVLFNIDIYTAFGSVPNIAGSFSMANVNCQLRDANDAQIYVDFCNQESGKHINWYQSFNASPNLQSVNGYTGLNVNPNIGFCQGFYEGVRVSNQNVTVFSGTQASVTIQDLTLQFLNPGENENSFSIEYVGGGIAGNEGVSLAGQTIQVQIEDGVSTADQIKAALESVSQISQALTVVVTGTGNNPQNVQSATSFTGGQWPATNRAASFVGDVNIDGNLSFSGALSLGELNAFSFIVPTDTGGQPQSVHSLISSVQVPDNVTINNADTLGFNTACLINVGENSTINTSLTGLAAMGLPAVVNMSSGATIDSIAGGLFALSLDGSSSGGSILELSLCKSIPLPNGITNVVSTYGFDFSAPFGLANFDNVYPFHTTENYNSYFRGGLVVGEDGKDVQNPSVLFEIKSTTGAFLNARMSTIDRDNLTATNGMQIYNTTTDKLQVYASGSWVDLH
jgi:hypothetical protein